MHEVETSLRRFEQEENLDSLVHARMSINAYEKSIQGKELRYQDKATK